MPDSNREWIVETEWLAERLGAPGIAILDGSWHLPSANRDARAEYNGEHIPGAQFFDIDEISDEASGLPHMLPSTVAFASRMKAMGIGDGVRVVVYDVNGIQSAARVWWMLRVMGHRDVAVLNGGLKKWKAEGRPVEDMPPPPRPRCHFTPRFNRELVRDIDDMRALLNSGVEQIADARPAGRFAGSEPEPRAGLRGGHIPGSLNVPSGGLVNSDGTIKSPGELVRLFEDAGIDLNAPVVTTCGSGVTACILALGLATLGRPNVGVYDGSWAEWGQDNGLPVATGSKP